MLVKLAELIEECTCPDMADSLKKLFDDRFQAVHHPELLTTQEILNGESDVYGRISTIKLYMKRTGRSLKDSKDAVESYFDKYSLTFGR